MSPGAFGWSVGDIVTAIKILHHIAKAFDEAKGAKKQYAASCGFLRQLISVIKQLEAHLKGKQDVTFQSDLKEQFDAINTAYEEFDAYLVKRYNGLSAKEASKAQRILDTIKWSFDELHDKVQKFKDRVNGAVQLYQARMLQEILGRVNGLESMVQDHSREDQTNFEEVSDAMKAVQEQLRLNQEFQQDMKDYEIYVLEDLKREQSEGTAVIRADVAGMRSDMNHNHEELMRRTESEAACQEESLLQCQNNLFVLINEHRKLAKSHEEAAQWTKIQMEAKKDEQANEMARNRFTDKIETTSEALDIVNGRTQNKHISNGIKDAQEMTKVFRIFGKIGIFGSSSDAAESSVSRAPRRPPPPRDRHPMAEPPTPPSSSTEGKGSQLAYPSGAVSENGRAPSSPSSAGSARPGQRPRLPLRLASSPITNGRTPDTLLSTSEGATSPPLPRRPAQQTRPALPPRTLSPLDDGTPVLTATPVRRSPPVARPKSKALRDAYPSTNYNDVNKPSP